MADATSVRPYLQLLVDTRYARQLIHRTVATRAEFDHYLRAWPQKRYVDYSVGYLAFHGDPECIYLGPDPVTLLDLGRLLAGNLTGKVVFFGSCKTLVADDRILQGFCQSTGARAVFDYTRYVDWIDSASFDLLLLREVLSSTQMKPIYKRMFADHSQVMRSLGFRVSTRVWSSPAKYARDAIA